MKKTKIKKKRLFAFLLLFLIITLVTGVLAASNFLFTLKNESVKINDQADITVVTANAFKYYDLNEKGELTFLSSEAVSLPGINITEFSMAEIEDRYLVFSAGNTMAHSKDQQIVSIDFETGKVLKNKEKEHYASLGAGASDKYFYTHQSEENGSIYQFDKFGKEVKSYSFDTSTLGSPQFVGKDGVLYFIGAREDEKDPSLYVDHLFVLEEEGLELKEDILLDDGSANVKSSTSLILIEDNLYAPIPMTRSRETYEKSGSNLYMKYNLKTKEKSYHELPENYPHLAYASQNEDYLIFAHEGSSLSKNGISVTSLADDSSYFINVNEILETQDIEEARILNVNTKDNYLFILTVNGLITWDMSSRELLSKEVEDFSFEAGGGIYVWVNKK